MSTAEFTFHGRLEFFLPRGRAGGPLAVHFLGRQSIKHLAESLGAPHPEVGRVQVNDNEGSLAWITQDGDRVELYPIEDGCPVEPRFLLDCHLGRLTAHMRMLGFDCLYRNDIDDTELAQIASEQGRILLTRDRRLLMRKVVNHGYCLRSLDSLEQAAEVLRRFELVERLRPFHRCLRCNGVLKHVDKEKILDRLEPLTKQYFDEFHLCPDCGGVYWKGSHFERMQGLVARLQAGG